MTLKNNISKDHPDILYGKTGVLIINLGTPEATDWFSIRKYLKEFLSDRRIIEVNRILWFLILNLIILTFRPSKTSKAYKEIWMEGVNKSPLRYYSEKLTEKVASRFSKEKVIVSLAMRYGTPSINDRINYLHKKGCEKIIALPLYPQYAAATFASVCDEVFRTFLKMRWQPSLQVVHHYSSNINYISALASSIKKKLASLNWTPDLIIASYHGIPKRYFLSGDPYHCYCHKTTRLVKEKLKISVPISTCFQSRFGPEEWLTPYTDKTLQELPKNKITKVLVFCPGFSCDCIETLEEIEIRAKDDFIKYGGKKFAYVNCLNDDKKHVNLIESLIKKYLVQ